MTIAWLYADFKPYALKHKLDILHDDMRFIERMLRPVAYHNQRRIMREYMRIWYNILHASDDKILAQSKGRKAANTYLLEQVTEI